MVQGSALSRQPGAGPALIPYLNGGITAMVGSAATTTSLTFVSTGRSISPVAYGLKNGQVPCIWFFAQAVVSNNTAGDGVQVKIYCTNGPANVPALGSPPGGGDVALGNPSDIIISTAANDAHLFRADIYDDTATNSFKSPPGTQFSYYLAFQAVTGGTASLAGPNGQALRNYLGWWEV